MNNLFTWVLGLALLTGTATVVYFLIWYIYVSANFIANGFMSLKPTTYVPLFITLLTALLGLFVTLWTQARARKRAIEEAHRGKKVDLYIRLLKLFQNLLLSSKEEFSDLKIPQNELVLQLAEIRTEMSLWASAKVLKSFYAITHATPESGDSKDLLSKIDPLYKAMRHDIGLGNQGLEEHFFAKSMLSDPSEWDRI